MVMTMAMTMASRGRRTKTAEIIAAQRGSRAAFDARAAEPSSAPGPMPGAFAAGAGETVWPGRMRWMPSTTTFSPSTRPLSTTASVGARRRLAELDAPLLRLVVLADEIDIVAALVGEHAARGMVERLDRLRVFQDDGDQLAVDESRGAPCPALALSSTGLAMTARKAIVSVLGATVLSRKSRMPVRS